MLDFLEALLVLLKPTIESYKLYLRPDAIVALNMGSVDGCPSKATAAIAEETANLHKAFPDLPVLAPEITLGLIRALGVKVMSLEDSLIKGRANSWILACTIKKRYPELSRPLLVGYPELLPRNIGSFVALGFSPMGTAIRGGFNKKSDQWWLRSAPLWWLMELPDRLRYATIYWLPYCLFRRFPRALH